MTIVVLTHVYIRVLQALIPSNPCKSVKTQKGLAKSPKGLSTSLDESLIYFFGACHTQRRFYEHLFSGQENEGLYQSMPTTASACFKIHSKVIPATLMNGGQPINVRMKILLLLITALRISFAF